ncbi:MAG: exodeoxyribonuclease VII small subunit [Pseudomonadota bacterium]
MSETTKPSSPSKAVSDDIVELSFEDALGRLEAIVNKLETGETTLDESIADYETGKALQRHCEQKLAEAKSRVERIQMTDQDEATTTPFDAES